MLRLIRHSAILEMLLVGARLRKGRLLRLHLPRSSRWQKQLPSQKQLLSAQRQHHQLLHSGAPRYAHKTMPVLKPCLTCCLLPLEDLTAQCSHGADR